MFRLMRNPWIAAAAVLAGLGVAAGAFGTHGLSGRLAPDLLEVFDTATRYHVLHSLALFGVGLAWERRGDRRWWNLAGWLFAAGVVVFSGSLYTLALTGARWWGAVTPVGGACFLAGWASTAVAALRAS